MPCPPLSSIARNTSLAWGIASGPRPLPCHRWGMSALVQARYPSPESCAPAGVAEGGGGRRKEP
eukprot:1836624-Pyramimonas_sp.AAC.1